MHVAPTITRPRIVVMDAPAIAAKLVERGYAAASGTFGEPFKVERSDKFVHVPLQIRAPGLTEADIVIVDLQEPTPSEDRPEIEPPAPGVSSVWSRLVRGIVDPRPLAMRFARDKIDRIQAHGGVLIVVADRRDPQPYVSAEIESRAYGESLGYATDERLDNWGLSSTLSGFSVRDDLGQEIVPTDAGRQLQPGSTSWAGHFTCTLAPPYRSMERWIPLARNKYDKDVAGVLLPAPDSGRGWTIVLPRLDRLDENVLDLFENLLPRAAPQLFELGDESVWTEDPLYQHSDVNRLRRGITEVRSRAEAEVLILEGRIEEVRQAREHLHTLLTGTGDDLVQAVITTMSQLGFPDVVDVDEAKREAGDSGPKREDVHVRVPGYPIVLGEIKGIEGLPREANSLQVAKYLIPRMKQWNDTNLRGLSIVNHQRHLPPLQRDNRAVFQGDVLTNAENQDITLLTTWELFRIARGAATHRWAFELIRPLFDVNGRPDVVPTHYRPIGTVEDVWPKAEAFAVTLAGGVKLGDRIAIEGLVDFKEFTVESIRLDDRDAEAGHSGEKIGIKAVGATDFAKKGMLIFAVVSASRTEPPTDQ